MVLKRDMLDQERTRVFHPAQPDKVSVVIEVAFTLKCLDQEYRHLVEEFRVLGVGDQDILAEDVKALVETRNLWSGFQLLFLIFHASYDNVSFMSSVLFFIRHIYYYLCARFLLALYSYHSRVGFNDLL